MDRHIGAIYRKEIQSVTAASKDNWEMKDEEE
jgi:hypothetical protein